MFNDIALVLIAMLQASLIVPTTGNHDRNARINGFVVSKTSSFMKALTTRLFDKQIRYNTDSRELWLCLKVVEILGLSSPELDRLTKELFSQALLDGINPNTNIIGVLLSIIPNQDLSTEISDLLELISSRLELLFSDISVLEGLEKILLNKST